MTENEARTYRKELVGPDAELFDGIVRIGSNSYDQGFDDCLDTIKGMHAKDPAITVADILAAAERFKALRK